MQLGVGWPAPAAELRVAADWLVQQRRRSWVTVAVSLLALVTAPLLTLPDLLRGHRLVTAGPAVEAVVLSTTTRRGPDSGWVLPASGLPARIGDLARVRPAPGDVLLIVLDPAEPDRALLAEDGPDVRWRTARNVLLGGVFPFLVVLNWRPAMVAPRQVRTGVAAALDRASSAGASPVARSFEVMASGLPLPRGSLSSWLHRTEHARSSHHAHEVALADGRTLSGQWSRALQLAPGVRGVAVGLVADDAVVHDVVLVLGGKVLWPCARPVQVHPPAGQPPDTTTGRPRIGDGPRADGLR